MKIIRVFAACLLAVAGSSCALVQISVSPTPVLSYIGDGGLLSEEPCGPPCFFGIVPGVSTFDDVKQSLEEYELIDLCSADAGADWICPGTLSFVRIHMNRTQSRVSTIIFRTENILLGDIVEKYGHPDYYDTYVFLDEAGNNLGYYTLELCFDKIRTIAELEYIDSDNTYLVQASTKVYEISYISAPCQGYYDPDLIHPWSGYGKYRPR